MNAIALTSNRLSRSMPSQENILTFRGFVLHPHSTLLTRLGEKFGLSGLVDFLQAIKTPEAILKEYPTLTVEDVRAALIF